MNLWKPPSRAGSTANFPNRSCKIRTTFGLLLLKPEMKTVLTGIIHNPPATPVSDSDIPCQFPCACRAALIPPLITPSHDGNGKIPNFVCTMSQNVR